MAEHGIDPLPYLRDVHDIDFSVLSPDPELAALIAALPLIPASALAQAAGPVTAIRNATILTVTRGTIDKGTIVIRNGKIAAVGAYVVFMGLNIAGVTIAATFELFVTVLAIIELLVFMGVVAPAFSFSHFALNGWAGSETFGAPAIAGIFAAIPFAILPIVEAVAGAINMASAQSPRST